MKEYSEDEHEGIIRALLLTFQNLNTYVGKKKFKKNIVLVTNSYIVPELDDEYASAIVDIVLSSNINMVLIGVDFDTPNLPETNFKNIASWRDLFDRIPGSVLMTGKQANDIIEYPSPKIVRPVKTFTGQLRIGADLIDETFQPHDDISCVCFEVEGYPATKVDRPPARKTFGLNKKEEPEKIVTSSDYEIRKYTDDFDNEKEMENADEDELESRPYDIQPVDRSELSKGYKYGKSTVVLPPVLEEKRKYKTSPGLDIRGVISSEKLPRCYLTSESVFIVGRKESSNDTRALSSLVDSLTEMDSFGIARYVQKPNAEVQMVVLIPVYIKKNGGLSNKRRAEDENLEDIRALILTRLPFFEDEKIAVFPPLTEVHTSSGKILKERHKFLPSDDAKDAMESFINNMDLDKLDGKETDFEGKKRIFNPLTSASLLPLPNSVGNHDNLVKPATGIHRSELTLKDLAIKSSSYKGGLQGYVSQENIIPPLNGQLLKDTLPNPKLAHQAESDLKKLAKLLDVKYIGKQNKANKNNIDEISTNEDEEEEEISLEDLLSRGAR